MNNSKRLSRFKIKPILLISYILIAAISVSTTLAFKNPGANPSPSLQPMQSSGQGVSNTVKNSKEADTEFTFIDNWYMNTRTKFIMDGIWYRMGNVDEILDTVKRIRYTSELSWFREWTKTAERVKSIGDDSFSRGHNISAGEAYLRAANYYLAAEVFLHTNPEDPRILETYKKGGDCFIKGLNLLSLPVSVVDIPYEGTTLKGYFFKADTTDAKAPVMIVHQGFDAPIESTVYIAEEAIRRGYNCLLFEGPGQGLTIREKKLPFRADWEKVITPVVDYVCTRPEVDKNNIILMGISMGGGFAVRAAAYEPRIKTCIVNPGYTNVYGIIKDMLTPKLINLYEQDPEEFNKKFLELTKYDVGLRWGVYHGMWVFGGRTPSDFLSKLKEFDCKNVTDKIKCQMLIMDGTKDTWGKGQAKELYDSLDCPKEYMLFTEEDSAASHCQTGGPAISTQRMFDWLDEHAKKQL